MAKVQQKSEIITAFGGIFFVLDKFDSILSSVIDSHLGLRSRLIQKCKKDTKERHPHHRVPPFSVLRRTYSMAIGP